MPFQLVQWFFQWLFIGRLGFYTTDVISGLYSFVVRATLVSLIDFVASSECLVYLPDD